MRASVICLALAAVVIDSAAFADPVTSALYTTSCSADGSSLTVGVQSCSAGIATKSSSYVSANANVRATLAANPAGYSDLLAVQSIRINTSGATTSSAGASSTINYRETLTTAGPLRSGYLLVQLVNHNVTASDNVLGGGSFSLSLTPSLAAQGGNVGCGMDVAQSQCGLSNDYLRHYNNLGGFSVELGQEFTLGFEGSLSGYANQFTGNGSSSLNLDYQFRFLDSDGCTPVQVFAPAPEPATFPMFGIVLVAVAAGRKRLGKLLCASRGNLAPLV